MVLLIYFSFLCIVCSMATESVDLTRDSTVPVYVIIPYILLVICSIIINFSVFTVGSKALKRNLHNILILLLCLGDAFNGIFFLWFAVSASVPSIQNTHTCLFTLFAGSFTVIMNPCTVFAISIERYVVVKALNFGIQKKLNSYKYAITAGIICFSFLVSLSLFFIPHNTDIQICYAPQFYKQYYAAYVYITFGTWTVFAFAAVVTTLATSLLIWRMFFKPNTILPYQRSNKPTVHLNSKKTNQNTRKSTSSWNTSVDKNQRETSEGVLHHLTKGNNAATGTHPVMTRGHASKPKIITNKIITINVQENVDSFKAETTENQAVTIKTRISVQGEADSSKPVLMTNKASITSSSNLDSVIKSRASLDNTKSSCTSLNSVIRSRSSIISVENVIASCSSTYDGTKAIFVNEADTIDSHSIIVSLTNKKDHNSDQCDAEPHSVTRNRDKMSWEINALKTTIMVATSTILLTGPFVASFWLELFLFSIQPSVKFLLNTLCLINYIIDPFVYVFGVPEIKVKIKHLFRQT